MAPPKKRFRDVPYADDPAWSDVVPLAQDDGGAHALATIAYTDEYREATSYLRALMAENELSERGLHLTEHVINLNPAYYTVWLYRARILEALHTPVPTELAWLNTIALRFIKNYQIWHHRQTLLARLDEAASPDLPAVLHAEPQFLDAMLEKDAKNYHVWSYRQWLVERFGMFDEDSYGELAATERWLEADWHNASAWNHRWFLAFGREQLKRAAPSDAVWQREWAYAQASIADYHPSNECPWNYLKAMLRLRGRKLAELRPFCEFFVDGEVEGVRSRPALRVLGDIFAEEGGEQDKVAADRLYAALEGRYDTVRARYWRWKRDQLGLVAAAA